MRKLFLTAALCGPLIAQMPLPKRVEPVKPLGNTRFPPAKSLEFKPQPATMVPVPARESSKSILARLQNQMVIHIPEENRMGACAHVRIVKVYPATDPKIAQGPPQGFESMMPVVKAVPVCDPESK